MTANGNKYLIAFQCSFTKYVIAVPIPNKEKTTIAKAFVTNVLLTHGIPSVLLVTMVVNLLMSL